MALRPTGPLSSVKAPADDTCICRCGPADLTFWCLLCLLNVPGVVCHPSSSFSWHCLQWSGHQCRIWPKDMHSSSLYVWATCWWHSFWIELMIKWLTSMYRGTDCKINSWKYIDSSCCWNYLVTWHQTTNGLAICLCSSGDSWSSDFISKWRWLSIYVHQGIVCALSVYFQSLKCLV